MSERIARRLRVHGRVQGVFFREETRRMAGRHGVAGWVSNRPDGTVEAVFEGARADVEALVLFCGRGPQGARVSRVEDEERAPEGLAGFEVRR